MSVSVKFWAWFLVAVLGIGLIILLIGPALFASIAYPLPQKYQESLAKWSLEYDLNPNFMAALIYTESTWNANAQSGAGAVGLTQFIPSTARAVASRLGVTPFTPSDLKKDTDLAIRFGAYYISEGIKRYGGDRRLALIAYNGGGGAVGAYRSGYPIRSTVAYANKIIAVEGVYERIYGRWWERADLPDLSARPKGTVDLISSIPVVDFWRNLLFIQPELPTSSADTASTSEPTDLKDFWRAILPGG